MIGPLKARGSGAGMSLNDDRPALSWASTRRPAAREIPRFDRPHIRVLAGRSPTREEPRQSGIMAFDRATMLAWTQAKVQLRHLGIGAGEAHLFRYRQREPFALTLCSLPARRMTTAAIIKRSSRVDQVGGAVLAKVAVRISMTR
jgi:hypothetical protein